MISYIGGKFRQASWINESIKSEITIYSEPFGGMFWTFFQTNRKFDRVIYNDINPLNSNLFLCVRDHRTFYEVVKDIEPWDEERFNSYQNILFNSGNDFEFKKDEPDYNVGLMYSYIMTHIFCGGNTKTSKMVKPTYHNSKFTSFKKKLTSPKWISKFDQITDVESLSYNEVLDKYDSELTHFYVDPPYFGTEKYYINHTFDSTENHLKLSEDLKQIKGYFSLSYYDFEGLNSLYDPSEFSYSERGYKKSAGAKKDNKVSGTGVEILIQNYENTNQTELPVFSEPDTSESDIEVEY